MEGAKTREDDKDTTARLAGFERGLIAQQNQLNDFQGETRDNLNTIFNKIDGLHSVITKNQRTDWQQVAVMLSVVSMLGVLVLVGFVNPLQREADIARRERESLLAEYLERFKDGAALDRELAVQKNETKWILKMVERNDKQQSTSQ